MIERSYIQGGLLPLKKEMKNILMLLFLKQFIELTFDAERALSRVHREALRNLFSNVNDNHT